MGMLWTPRSFFSMRSNQETALSSTSCFPFRRAFIVPFEAGAHTSGTVGWKKRQHLRRLRNDRQPGKALWRAGVLWKNESFLEESLSLIRGYLAHESGKEKSWQIRN